MKIQIMMFKTYVLNLLQVISMGLFNILVPFFVGFDSYGYYVSVFAIPGFVVALLETRLLVNKDDSVNAVYIIVFFVMSLFVNGIVLGYEQSVFTGLIYITLVCRCLIYVSIVRLPSADFNEIYFKSEFISICCFVLMFLCSCFFVNDIDQIYLVFIFFFSLNMSFSLVGYLFLRGVNKEKPNVNRIISIDYTIQSASFDIRKITKIFNYRLFEDYIFTFSPLLLSLSGGNQFAGVYKFHTSMLKLGIKFYPVRYETFFDFIGFIHKNNIKKVLYLNILISLFIFGGMLLFLVLTDFFKIGGISLHYGFLSMLVMCPFFAFVIAAFPAEVDKDDGIVILQIATISILLIFSQLYYGLYGFLISLFIFFYFILFYLKLSKTIRGKNEHKA